MRIRCRPTPVRNCSSSLRPAEQYSMNREPKDSSPKWTDEGLPLVKRRELLQQELKNLLVTARTPAGESAEHPVQRSAIRPADAQRNADTDP